MPAVSVIIPTYNCGPYLRESLDSMLTQTLAADELIVVDDGSTDDTPAILASYGDRIRVVPGAHGGLAAARNLGLTHARGDWIAFQDADDIADPERLARHRAFLNAHPQYDTVFCNGRRMDLADTATARVIPGQFAGRTLDGSSMFEGYPLYFQGGLVPRRAFERAGPFNPRYQVQPDLEYGYRLLNACRAQFVDEVVFLYRWHGSNMTRDRLRVREDIVRILEGLPAAAPRAVAQIGEGPLRQRIARHHYRIGRLRLARGDGRGARASFAAAAALEPLHLRYQWARLQSAWRS